MHPLTRTQCLCTAISCALLCASPPAQSRAVADPPGRAPADSATAAAALSDLQRRIAALAGRQQHELEQRDAANAALREAELAITGRRRRIDELRAQESAALRRRAALRSEATRVQSTLDAARAALAEDVRSAYVTRTDSGVIWLAGQTDAARLGRMATYAGYFARRRAADLDEIRARAAALDELTAQISRLTDRLRSLQADAEREIVGLERGREARAASLAALEHDLAGDAGELQALRRQASAEEALLAELSRVVADLPGAGRRGFADLRGRLAWPVAGRILGSPQESRVAQGAAARWSGVLIDAARGAKVRAPCRGRVVYADWLQGLGFLLIIAHDGDFMTLYGHAEVLYKSVGDEVVAGEVIAALRDTGAAPPQLYFEIREGRSPRDPRIWLEPMR